MLLPRQGYIQEAARIEPIGRKLRLDAQEYDMDFQNQTVDA